MTDQPVGIPSTCEEPIYQLTPQATVPSVPLPAVCATEPAAIVQLPATGSGAQPGGWWLMPLALLVVGLLGWYGIRSADRALAESGELP